VGVAKARMATLPLLMLGVLAGAFIGLGSMLSLIVRADPSLGLAAAQIGSGLVFSLVVDKAVAVIFPIAAFVAAGFEHAKAPGWRQDRAR
jgi:formate/nitrite transporter FocA (FNT family)